MGYILDIIVVGIIALCVFLSAKKGFVRTAIELAGFILAIVLAFNLAPTVADGVYDATLDKPITKKIASAIDERAGSSTANISEAVWDSVPGFISSNIEHFGITQDEVNAKLNKLSTSTSAEIAAELSKETVKPILSAAISGIVGIIIFVLISIATKFLAIPINKIFSFSLVGTLNRVLGAVLGAGKGVVFAAVFCLIISCLVVFTGEGFLIFTREAIEDSTLTKLLCSFNPIF